MRVRERTCGKARLGAHFGAAQVRRIPVFQGSAGLPASSTVTSPPLVGCSGLLGRSQEYGLALTLDVPQPLPEPHDSYCVVISE